MTITLHLKPQVEAGLIAQARSRGMVLEDYLLTLLEDVAHPSGAEERGTELVARDDAVRRMMEFGAKYQLSLREPITRTLLHEGHRC
jgi:hypothetical protein